MIRQVAIIYPFVPWMFPCLDGIRRYAREHGHWRLLCGAGGHSLKLRELRGWSGDGIIALVDDERELRGARRKGVPVVNLGSRLPLSHGIPRVMVDHRRGGQLAAEHLLGWGLRHLAFFGWEDAWYSDQRRLGFTEQAAGAGVDCRSFLVPFGDSASTWQQRIVRPAKWLATLPRPCGVFAVHDYRAELLVQACEDIGLRIPEEVALIGMDNDENICAHTQPTLTSVPRSSEEVGWEAAALLDRMMRGDRVSAEDVFVRPGGVVARQSTDLLHCPDPLVKSALDFMRANLKAQFNIAQVARRLGISKRTLEKRFRDGLGHSPHEFLSRLRVQQAQKLIRADGKRSLARIAAESGFVAHRTLSAAFRRVTGKPPGHFRRQDYAGGAGIPEEGSAHDSRTLPGRRQEDAAPDP